MENRRNAEIVSMRLKGLTLEAIGQEFDMTRERIRQIVAYALSKLQTVDEDKYAYLIQTYNINESQFNMAFNEPIETYFYLTERYTKGKKNIVEILDDENIAWNDKRNMEKVIYKDFIKIDNTRVKLTRDDILKYALKKYAQEQIRMDEFIDLYENLLKELNIADNKALNSGRGFKNKLAESKLTLLSMGKKIRYYNIKEEDYTLLIDELNFKSFHNIEISTLKLFKENPELMELYDIRDEYELHNLLKKIKLGEYDGIELLRMPGIRFGQGDRFEQVENLLLELAPISQKEFAQAYQEKYGVGVDTVLANYVENIAKYLDEGEYALDIKLLPPDKFLQFKEVLTEDFYTRDDLIIIFKKMFPNETTEMVNSIVLRDLGFKVYSSYVISDKYEDAMSFFEQILTKENYTNVRNFSSQMRSIVLFNEVLMQLKQSFEIIENEWQQHINIRVLEDRGIRKEQIKAFCDWVYDNVDEEYFTIQYLQQKGIKHPLFDLGYNEFFYASILSADVERFSYLRISHTKILSKVHNKVRFVDFVMYLVEKQITKSINVYTLQQLLKNQYNIEYEKYKIREKINNTSLFYSSVHFRIYKDYDTFEKIEGFGKE